MTNTPEETPESMPDIQTIRVLRALGARRAGVEMRNVHMFIRQQMPHTDEVMAILSFLNERAFVLEKEGEDDGLDERNRPGLPGTDEGSGG